MRETDRTTRVERFDEVDGVVAAERFFSAYMRVGRAFGVGREVLARQANAVTLAFTGINFMADLGITDADLPPNPPDLTVQDPLLEPLQQWLAGRDNTPFTADTIMDDLKLKTGNRAKLRSRIGALLAKLGVPRKRERTGGRQITVYYPSAVR